jgi:hypothetical protein
MIQKEYTKPQLIKMPRRESGIVSPKGNRQQILDTAKQAGIALTKGNVKSYKGGKESQRGWNKFFGNEGGLIQPSLAKCAGSKGQRI